MQLANKNRGNIQPNPKAVHSTESNFEEQYVGMNGGAEVKSLFTSYAYFLQQYKAIQKLRVGDTY